MAPPKIVLQPGQVVLRHIKLGTSTDPGAIQVLGQYFVPSRAGVNGLLGFQSGSYERRLNEEGSFTLTFPNAAGEDGVLHRDRFDVIRRGKRDWSASGGTAKTIFTVAGGQYRPGDEWFEIYRVSQGQSVGELLFIGTPTQARVTLSTITISGMDAFWLLRKQRDTAAGWWKNSPRDVFEQYTRVWQFAMADDFGSDLSPETRFTWGTTEATTADGEWKYLRAENGSAGGINSAVRLRPGAAATQAYVYSQTGIPFGTNSSDPLSYWRVETTVRPTLTTANDAVVLSLVNSPRTGTYAFVYVQLYADGYVRSLFNMGSLVGSTERFSADQVGTAMMDPWPGPFRLAIEGRGRYAWFYVNGELVGVMPMPYLNGTAYPFVHFICTDTSISAQVENINMRRQRRFLLQGSTGDQSLAGLPSPGGLLGSYYDNAEFATDTSGDRALKILTPLRQPYSQRQDANINIAFNGSGSTIIPPGPPNNEYFSARWVGSIYLDLTTSDILLRASATGTSSLIWVGRTRYPQESYTYSTSLRTHLGSQSPGWYPIIIEYTRSTESSWVFLLQYSINGGSTWNTVPNNMLSPIGIHDNTSRFNSHYDGIVDLANTFALQFTCVPQQLESGNFPGIVQPEIRVGRDTEKIIDVWESTEIAVDINTEDVCDAMYADAQGLADPKGGGQITVEDLNYDEVLNSHLLLSAEYESVPDIGIQSLLKQRVDTLLALRGSAWEQVAARPAGRRELLDTFPLSDAAAEFAWEPGDGARIWLGEIGVEDPSPRQIMGVEWPIFPDGIGRPSVAFRQRPRGIADAIRKLRRESLQATRNYQSQFVLVNGTTGANSTTFAPEIYTRLNLPDTPGDTLSATLVVMHKSDTSTGTVAINGTNRFTITRIGRYDITGWIAPASTATTIYNFVTITGATGNWIISTEAIVRV